MSIISNELSHIIKMRKSLQDILEGGDPITELQKDFFELDLKYLSESAKRINSTISLLVSSAKHSRGIRNMADTINLLDQTAIDTGDPNLEMIKCLNRDELISRAECLDLSGDAENKCSGCQQFAITREKLCKD